MVQIDNKNNSGTLLCVSSVIRSFSDLAFKSIIKNLLPFLQGPIDIIGHSPPGNEKAIEILKPYCRRLLWKFVDDPQFTEKELGMDYRAEKCYNVMKNNLLQWHSLEQCGFLKKEIENEIGPASTVIWTRPDLLFLWPVDLPANIPSQTIFLSPHDMWNGVNDRFCFGDSKTLSLRMDQARYFKNEWYPRLKQNPDRILNGKNTVWIPETILSSLIRDRKLNVKPTYTIFCRLKDIGGRVYGITPHRRGFRSDFPDIIRRMKRDPSAKQFLLRLARLFAQQRDDLTIVDPRSINQKFNWLQKLDQLLAGGNFIKRLVLVETLLEIESELS